MKLKKACNFVCVCVCAYSETTSAMCWVCVSACVYGGCRAAATCSRHLHFSLYRIAVVPVMFAFVA